MPFPIAMYSKSFVGEPKNGVPSALGRVGDARMSHAARYAGPSACGTSPVRTARSSTPCSLEVPDHLRHRVSVAHHEQPHALAKLGGPLDQTPEGLRKHLCAVPPAERTDEADNGLALQCRAAAEPAHRPRRASRHLCSRQWD